MLGLIPKRLQIATTLLMNVKTSKSYRKIKPQTILLILHSNEIEIWFKKKVIKRLGIIKLIN